MNERADSDLQTLSRDLKIPVEVVRVTVQLLDEGNTTAFIARFRRDQTNGLSESNILEIKRRVAQLRALTERKAIILKSIESQGKLTDELSKQVEGARSSKRLEDLYLPFKPQKQSLAALARQRGLEPLAKEIFEGKSSEDELAPRAREFVRVDKGLDNIDDVMKGVGHLLAEQFSENIELRSRLRKILWKSGKLTAQLVADPASAVDSAEKRPSVSDKKNESEEKGVEEAAKSETKPSDETADPAGTADDSAQASTGGSESVTTTDSSDAETGPVSGENAGDAVRETSKAVPTASDDGTANETSASENAESPARDESAGQGVDAENPATPTADGSKSEETANAELESRGASEKEESQKEESVDSKSAKVETTSVTKPVKKKKKKKKKKPKEQNPFADYANFSELLNKLPPHRVLAINRGERAKKLKVKLTADDEAIRNKTFELMVPPGHAFQEFLQKCALDALNRLILPSLEREIRRELSEKAERHALEVFGRNLRSLLFQPPVRGKRILAIDPGYRGCRAAVTDEFGNLLGHDVIQIVGNEARRADGKKKLTALAKDHGVSIIAIGNGAACRQAEQLVSSMLSEELKDSGVQYAIVNEAGTSVYSTSDIGREELPDCEPVVRSAVSIARRLMDPMSEFVKVNPANLGVGLYQHDIKSKHLADALDDVVSSCVNYVGVNVNTASPALLRYVSGLSQLTARRLYEHRLEHGPFRDRQDFKKVAGFGDQTFQQAAGFLRIPSGDNPLDATAIHPESYETAVSLLEKIGFGPSDLGTPQPPAPVNVGDATAQPVVSETSGDAKSASGETAPESVTPADGAEKPVGTDVADSATETVARPDSETPPTESAVTDTANAASTDPDSAAGGAEMSTTNSSTADATETDATETDATKAEATQEAPAERKNRQKEIRERLAQLDTKQLANELHVGSMLMHDIVQAIAKPGRDPREKCPKPIFREGIIKIENLEPNIRLRAQVLNVVDFGVFVDIGLGESSLIHISRLSNGFVSDPHQLFSIGDTLDTWVTEVDRERRRVTLTAVDPAKKTEKRERRSGGRPRKPEGRGGQQGERKKRFSKKHSGKPAARRERPRKPARPAPPITQAMVEGKEAMRSFSDLAQFFEKKTDEDSGKE